jgi:hypothetical protein
MAEDASDLRRARTAREKRAVELVRNDLKGNDDHQVDANPLIAVADEGVWVQTWVWISNEETNDV